MARRSKRLVVATAVAVAAGMLVVPSAAFAAGPGSGSGGGRGSGSGGGGAPGQGEEPTTANNLSVPTIFVPDGTSFGLTCPSGPTLPTGEPSTGYPISPGSSYYVQGVNTWQAECATATTGSGLSVDAAWGDNLTGAASLTTKHPIRIEMSLSTSAQDPMQGFDVLKLDPEALDRVSAYGTLATATASGFTATPTTFDNPGVWDAGGGFTITNSSGTTVATSSSAEINATGRVVYGYNFDAPSAGDYTITFTAPDVTIAAADAGTPSGDTVALSITVGSGAGGGNGGGPGNGGRGGHGGS